MRQRTKSGTLQGAQNPDTKANLAKSLPWPSLPGHTPPRWTQAFNSTYQDEGRTYYRGPAAMLADEYILSFISLSAHIRLTEFFQL